jgi:hypothetical protein
MSRSYEQSRHAIETNSNAQKRKSVTHLLAGQPRLSLQLRHGGLRSHLAISKIQTTYVTTSHSYVGFFEAFALFARLLQQILQPGKAAAMNGKNANKVSSLLTEAQSFATGKDCRPCGR